MLPKITPLLFKTYIAIIKTSLGSKLFQSFYALSEGKEKDIMRKGDLSCAFYVSSILLLAGLIIKNHGTVKGTVEDMKKSGWHIIKKPRIGSVLIWEEKRFKNEHHTHIGFYVGSGKAISNSSRKRFPVLHHWTFGMKQGKPARKIEAIYWNKKLEK